MLRVCAVGLWVLLVPAWALAQPTGHCAPTTLDASGATGATGARRWTAAVSALRTALMEPGHPWSCMGAQVAVDPAGDALRVEVVTADGRHAVRHVDNPVDLAVTVEAVLIPGDTQDHTPVPEAGRRHHPAAPQTVPPSVPPSAAPRSPAEAVPAQPESTAGVRLVAGMDGGLRMAGPATAAMLSAGVHGGACVGHGCFTAWARYDSVVAGFDTSPGDLDVSVLTGGVCAAWGWPVGAGRIEAGPTFSVAGVVQSLSTARSQRADTAVQPRVGAAVRWRSRAQGVGFTAAMDVDGAPGSPGGALGPRLPGPPAWSVGATAGVSLGGLP